METVKKMLGAGVGISTAIKEAVEGSITGFADRHDLSRTLASEVVNLTRPPRQDVCAALAAELGGSAYEWAELLWQSAKPEPARFAA